jgi:hypothetical protein
MPKMRASFTLDATDPQLSRILTAEDQDAWQRMTAEQRRACWNSSKAPTEYFRELNGRKTATA